MSARTSRPTAKPVRGSGPREIRRLLLRWYRAHGRDLPWRHNRDPYAIWISETMLQQTRVDTVIPYYERFLERLPDIEALATADQDDVYGLWAGLGYYSRARNLQAAARDMVERFDGRVPSDREGLLSLPGIGRYTAGAVASIAFDQREPVVDGNVARVLARVLGIREDIASSATTARLWEVAGEWVDGPDPGDLNQAIMELGATLCTPRRPRCEACPIRRHCDARRMGDPEALPVKRRKKPPTRVEAAAIWVERRGRLLMVRRETGGLLGGLWGPPGGDLERSEEPREGAQRLLREATGLRVDDLQYLGAVEHLFTHRALRLNLFRSDGARGRTRLSGFDEHRWSTRAQLRGLPRSALADKALALLREPGLPLDPGR